MRDLPLVLAVPMENSRSPYHPATRPGAPRRWLVRLLLALIYPVLLLLFLFLLSLLFVPSAVARVGEDAARHLVASSCSGRFLFDGDKMVDYELDELVEPAQGSTAPAAPR